MICIGKTNLNFICLDQPIIVSHVERISFCKEATNKGVFLKGTYNQVILFLTKFFSNQFYF